MFIILDPAFNELGEVDIRLNRDVIEALLFVHLQGHHIFTLTPRQLLLLRGALAFQGLPAKALEVISRKSQAYYASMRNARTVLSVRPISSGGDARISGREISVSPQWLSARINSPPSIFLENAVNDGRLYKILIERVATEVGADASMIVFRPVHGGGGTLGSVLEDVHGHQLKGLCICDKDLSSASPLPLRSHSTAEGVFEALVRMGVINASCESTINNPLFSFKLTAGWSLENYIGPNQLDIYFEAEHGARALRASFVNVFPKFPDLSAREMALWLSINFRASQDEQHLKTGYEGRVGAQASNAAQMYAASELVFPAGVVQWIAKNATGSQWSRKLTASYKRDLSHDCYKEALQDLAISAHYLLAGDATIGFS